MAKGKTLQKGAAALLLAAALSACAPFWRDTQPPQVTTRPVTVKHYEEGVDGKGVRTQPYAPEDFIESYSDNSRSEVYTAQFGPDFGAFQLPGEYAFTLLVADETGNQAICPAELTILGVGKRKAAREERYGVKVITEDTVTYRVEKDGSQVELGRVIGRITEINSSGFTGTAPVLRPEAEGLQPSLGQTREEILGILNGYREEAGVPPLVLDEDLSLIATVRAMEIAYTGKFSHQRPDGRSWSTLKDDLGFGLSVRTVLGENLAKGYDGVNAKACEGWKNSPLHYQNIVDPSFTRTGIGRYTLGGTTYWTQWFSSAELAQG